MQFMYGVEMLDVTVVQGASRKGSADLRKCVMSNMLQKALECKIVVFRSFELEDERAV